MAKTGSIVPVSIFILISISVVVAQGLGNIFMTSDSVVEQALMQHQLAFENRHQFECSGECEYSEVSQTRTMIQVTHRYRILFFNLPMKEQYLVDSEGVVHAATYNVWSMIFNKERIGVGE